MIWYLYDASKIVSINEVVCFQEDLSKFTGSHWVILGIELIKPVEGVSPLDSLYIRKHICQQVFSCNGRNIKCQKLKAGVRELQAAERFLT